MFYYYAIWFFSVYVDLCIINCISYGNKNMLQFGMMVACILLHGNVACLQGV